MMPARPTPPSRREPRSTPGRDQRLGPDHPHALTNRNNLATAYQTAGDLTRAITLHEQDLADAERALSPGHPMIETIRANLERARSGEN